MIKSIHARVPELHRQELLATAARARLVHQATSADSRTPGRRPAARAFAYARCVLAFLTSVAYLANQN